MNVHLHIIRILYSHQDKVEKGFSFEMTMDSRYVKDYICNWTDVLYDNAHYLLILAVAAEELGLVKD